MEQKWDYKVGLKEIKVVDNFGNLVRNRMATVDEETGEVLGLVSNRYNLIQNKTLFEAMTDVGKEVGLQLQKVSVCKNKSITIFRYGFGEKLEREVKNSSEKNDKVQFGIEVFNSFDGGLCAGFRAFATRLVCTNGMTLPRNISRFSFRHLGGFDRDKIQEALNQRLTPILDSAKVWEDWTRFTPDRIKVGQFISSRVGKKAGELLLKNYDEGKDKSLWGLYNVITYHITHNLKVHNENNLRLKQWELGRIEQDIYNTDLK